MKIVVCGANGFVGNAIGSRFEEDGHTVHGVRIRPHTTLETITAALEGADALINLAGANILGRWSNAYKEVLRSSRLETTRKLAEAVAACSVPPRVVLNASAVGIYDVEHQHDETSRYHADDFLARLVRDWEREALAMASEHTRVCLMRFGVVYGAGGGAMAKMLPPFRLGLGGKMGDGFQMISWIHLDDLVRACAFLIETDSVEGVVNLTSPEPLSNHQQVRIMGRILGRPTFFDLPAWAVQLAFGEGSSVMLDSKEVYPKVLQEAGFEFRYPTFDTALEQIVRAQGEEGFPPSDKA